MNKESFDHIEKKIREAAENVSPEFSENSWDEMNDLLDREFPVKKRKSRGLLLVGLIAALVVAVGIGLPVGRKIVKSYDTAMMKQHPDKTNALSSAGSPEAKTTPVPDAMGSVNTLQSKRLLPDAMEPREGRVSQAAIGSQERNVREITGVQEAGRSSSLMNADNLPLYGPLSADSSLLNAAAVTRIKENREINATPGMDKETISWPVRQEIGRRGPAKTESRLKPGVAPFNIKPPEFNSSLRTAQKTGSAGPSDDTSRAVMPVKINRQASVSGFYLTAITGVAGNSVAALSSGRLSGEYGLGIGYRFSRRLSAQLQFLAGRKKYAARGYDYKFEQGSYFTTVNVLDIDADCYVYDVPVSIRYDWLWRTRYALYATAGLSSFYMRNENYLYNYEKGGSYHTANRSYKGNLHLLSAAGLSVGYERRLTSAISVTAEPYIKMPLTGIGEGKIRLHSAGLLLGIKYDLQK